MPDLLLELFSEEIPARMQGRAAHDLERAVCSGLREAGLDFVDARSFATPRRVTLAVSGLPSASPDIREERKGPRVGAPDKAVEGFLRAAGLASVKDAVVQEDPKKGSYYVAVIERAGRPAADVVAAIVPEVVRKFPWPKSMRWGSGDLRWVRPLHGILCLLDAEPVGLEVDGVASGKSTWGHRFMAPEPIAVQGFADYLGKLNAAKVVLDPHARGQIILERARQLAEGEGLELIEDRALIEENAGLAEWPVVLMGGFDETFLDVPPEVLTTAMKKHQKCFSLRDPKSNKLANRFILVSNLEAQDGGTAIVAGNERVIRARLSDAKFFWDQDRSHRLDDRLPALEGVIFHEKLGTQAERVERLRALARELAPVIGADPDKAERAAELCKADLVTDMVGEFPDLQGLMGRYYALEQGEDESVARAIEEHYRPQGPNDAVPTDPVSIAVALADKLDTLVGFWSIDETPTGSKDPYALRRAALGAIRIVLETTARARLSHFFSVSGIGHWNQAMLARRWEIAEAMVDLEEAGGVKLDPEDIKPYLDQAIGVQESDSALQHFVESFHRRNDLLTFFHDRLKVHLRDEGARHDLIDAVISPEADDLLMIVRRVEALGAFLDTDDGANLLAGVKRAQNILRIEEKKDKTSYAGDPDPKLYGQKEEKALAAAIDDAVTASAKAIEREDFEAAMGAIARLRAPVDDFFDRVTVNDEDAKLRANRLRLLAQIRRATLEVADFSKIEG